MASRIGLKLLQRYCLLCLTVAHNSLSKLIVLDLRKQVFRVLYEVD